MQKVMGASGAESLNVAASIFMGQTEAPLTIRPFLAGLTQSELFTIMASGMAHVSGRGDGGLRARSPDVEIRHLLTAVIMTAPGHHHAGQDLHPGSRTSRPPRARWKSKSRRPRVNIIDAAAQGAGDGLHLALNIGGHADRVSGADRDGERHPRLAPHAARFMGWLPASLQADLRHHLRARGLAAGRALEGLRRPSATCWARAWCSTNSWRSSTWARSRPRSIRAPSSSPPTRSAASPTSAPSPFRSAASARWRPRARSDLARLGLKAVAAGTMANFMSACIAGMLL